MLGCSTSIRAQASGSVQAQAPQDSDHTLQAMRDEMARSKTRLELQIPGTPKPQRPYYVEYHLLDLDVREVVSEFGAPVPPNHPPNPFMGVQTRIGRHKPDRP